MAYLQNDAKKLLNKVANSQVLSQQAAQQPNQDPNQPQQEIPSNQGISGSQPIGQQIQPSAPKAPTASGAFTNIQQYAQKNVKAGANLAGAVQQGLQTAADVTKKNIDQTGQKFNTEVEAGSLQNRGTAQSEIQKATLTAAGGVQDPTAQAKQLAEQQAQYKQLVPTYDPKIKAQQALLDEANKKQAQYNDYTKAKAVIEDVKKYFSQTNTENAYGTINRLKDLKGNQFADTYSRNPLLPTSKATVLQNALDSIYGKGKVSIYGKGKQYFDLTKALKDPKFANKYYASVLGQVGFKNKELLADYNTAPVIGKNGKIVQAATATPKYTDQTKQLTDYNTAIAQLNAEKKSNEALSTFAPRSVDVPALLAQASSYTGDVSDQRVKDILNAAYKGPEALYEIKGYDETLEKARQADRKLGMVDRSGVKSNLLQDIFSKPERSYTRGSRNLDSAILGQSGKLGDILQTKKDIGNVSDVLTAREQAARGLSGERTSEIDSIREKSKGSLQDIAKARDTQIESRLENVVKDWDKLPTYLRTRLKEGLKSGGAGIELSGAELSLLGASGGEGLYNAISKAGINNVIKTTAASKDRLIGKDEQSQLARLQELAKMSEDYGTAGQPLNYANKYSRANRAGTQTSLDAFDRENFSALQKQEEDKFMKAAKAANIAVTGRGEESTEGGYFSSDTISYAKRDANAKIKDVLKKMGYKSDYIDSAEGKDFAKALAGSMNMGHGETEDEINNLIATRVSAPQANANFKNIANNPISYLSPANGFGTFSTPAIAAATAGLIPKIMGNKAVSNAVGNVFGKDTGHAQGVAAQRAEADAKKKLQAGVEKWFKDQGFSNRLVQNSSDANTLARMPELARILAGLDLTNSNPTAIPAQNQSNQANNTNDIITKLLKSNRK